MNKYILSIIGFFSISYVNIVYSLPETHGAVERGEQVNNPSLIGIHFAPEKLEEICLVGERKSSRCHESLWYECGVQRSIPHNSESTLDMGTPLTSPLHVLGHRELLNIAAHGSSVAIKINALYEILENAFVKTDEERVDVLMRILELSPSYDQACGEEIFGLALRIFRQKKQSDLLCRFLLISVHKQGPGRLQRINNALSLICCKDLGSFVQKIQIWLAVLAIERDNVTKRFYINRILNAFRVILQNEVIIKNEKEIIRQLVDHNYERYFSYDLGQDLIKQLKPILENIRAKLEVLDLE